MRISFTVLGTPAPQGSKTKWGTEDNPRTRPWRDTVAWEAREAMIGLPPLAHSLNLNVTFRLGRPKAHYRTGKRFAELRPDAPLFVEKRPDLDKLLRAVLDACTTGGVWYDDSQVATIHARKVYASDVDLVGCDIVVEEIDWMGAL